MIGGGADAAVPAKQGWLSGATLLGGGRAVTLVLQAAQLALVARLLNPTEFGTWAAATALVLVASALADCGLGPTAVIYLTSGEGTLDDVVAANTVAMICAVILVCAASLGFGSAVAIATLSLTPWLVITRLQAPSVAALQQRLHLKRIVVGDLVGTSLQTALLAGLLAAAGSSGQLARMILVGVCLALGAVVELRIVNLTRLAPTPSSLRDRGWVRLLRFSASLGVVNGVSMLHSKVDQLALALLVSRATLGGYAVAYRVVDASLTLASVASRAGFTVLVRRAADERSEVRRSLILTWAAVGALGTICVWFAAPVLMPLLGGSAYPASIGLLRLLAPIVMIAAINNAAAQSVIADRNSHRLLWVTLVGLTLNAVLCFALIPRIGADGAAIACLITESLGMLLVLDLAIRARERRAASGHPPAAADSLGSSPTGR